MKDQFSYYEHIDRYLTNQMQDKELADFEKELASNTALRKEINLQRELRSVVIGASLDEIRSMMDKDLGGISRSNKQKWWIVGLALVSIITIGTLIYSPNKREAVKKPIEIQESKQEEQKIIEEKPHTSKVSADVEPSSKEIIITSTSPIKKSPTEKAERNVDTKENKFIADSTAVLSIEEQTQPKNNLQVKSVDTLVKTDNTIITMPLHFTGKLRSNKSDYKAFNGEIIIEGKVSGGKTPYLFFIYEEETQATKNFYDLEKGNYTVKVMDANNDTLILGDIYVDESKCIENYNKSFVPMYDVNWELPVHKNNEFLFKVFNQTGVVYENDFETGDEYYWNGKDLNGMDVKVGYYRFEIKYSSGEQCFGELTIGK